MARRRHAGPATDAKRAAEQRQRDRRRQAAAIREMYADELGHLRVDEVWDGPLFAELLLRAARAGDPTAVRILGVGQHLTGLGYDSVEQVDPGLLREVEGIHAGRLARQSSTSPATMVA